jgi:putative acetyltransferase
MIIRKAESKDADRIWEIHKNSVRVLCQPDYSKEQIEAWAGHRMPADYRQRILGGHFYAAEMDGNVIGYARYNPKTNELCSIFVDPLVARRGVGKALVDLIFEDAAARGMTHLWLDASLTAVSFYQAAGFSTVEETKHDFSGVSLECVRMTKQFSPTDKEIE